MQVCDFRILSLVVVDASKAPFKITKCLTGEKRKKSSFYNRGIQLAATKRDECELLAKCN